MIIEMYSVNGNVFWDENVAKMFDRYVESKGILRKLCSEQQRVKKILRSSYPALEVEEQSKYQRSMKEQKNLIKFLIDQTKKYKEEYLEFVMELYELGTININTRNIYLDYAPKKYHH